MRDHTVHSAVMTESVGVLVSVWSSTTTTLVSRPASSCLTLATVDTTALVSGSVQSMSAKTTTTLGSTLRFGHRQLCCLKIDWVEGEGMSVGASVTGEGLPESSPLALIIWAKAYKANQRLGDRQSQHQAIKDSGLLYNTKSSFTS